MYPPADTLPLRAPGGGEGGSGGCFLVAPVANPLSPDSNHNVTLWSRTKPCIAPRICLWIRTSEWKKKDDVSKWPPTSSRGEEHPSPPIPHPTAQKREMVSWVAAVATYRVNSVQYIIVSSSPVLSLLVGLWQTPNTTQLRWLKLSRLNTGYFCFLFQAQFRKKKTIAPRGIRQLHYTMETLHDQQTTGGGVSAST